MKKRDLFIVAIFLTIASILMTGLNTCQVMAESENGRITVIGNASISATPDHAKISAEVQTLNMDSATSKNENFEIFEKVINSLTEAGIEKNEITLDYFTSYASYDYNNGKTLLGYYTTTDFSFNVENLDKTKNLIDTLISNGATVKSITYNLSNMEEKYNEVLNLAVENAMTKGKLLGGEKVVEIKEENTFSSPTLYKCYYEGISSNELVGQLTINCRVTVIFE